MKRLGLLGLFLFVFDHSSALAQQISCCSCICSPMRYPGKNRPAEPGISGTVYNHGPLANRRDSCTSRNWVSPDWREIDQKFKRPGRNQSKKEKEVKTTCPSLQGEGELGGNVGCHRDFESSCRELPSYDDLQKRVVDAKKKNSPR